MALDRKASMTMVSLRLAVLVFALVLGGYPFRAMADAVDPVMEVPLNKSQILRASRPFARAVIGNADIADVLPTSTSSVYVIGKRVGTTNLALYDAVGGVVAVVDVNVGPDAQGLKRKLAELMPGEPISVSVSNDSLVLQGPISSAAAALRAATLAETFSPKHVVNLMSVTEPQQVLLEVRFAEMSRTTVKQLGLNNISWGGGRLSSIYAPAPDATLNPYSAVIRGGTLSAQLDALDQKGIIRTLAQPNLIAMSGESANFLAGAEFPVPVQTTVSNGIPLISIEFKPFGISLAFAPTVIADGVINLSVGPEVSEIDNTIGLTLAGTKVPGLKVRRAKTVVELHDGEAFAMAGLIQREYKNTVQAIPGLGQTPIIGALFRSSNFNRGETELVIIVTPHIVKPVRPEQLRLPIDRVGEPRDSDIMLKGKVERDTTPPSAPQPGGLESDYGHVIK